LKLVSNSFSTRLLLWFDQHGRHDLPWQLNITPYRVWVSEVMLQQTQTATAAPYFATFIDLFPSIDRLASASIDVVLHTWTGLGYYARARNLHKAANLLMSKYNGELPMSVSELEALPGIGPSTAGAIVAICTNRRATILDGNVKRVLARCFAIKGWPGSKTTAKALWRKAEQLTPDARVRDYTQAIMDLGATLCTRSSPDCANCPFRAECIAYRTSRCDQFPARKPKQVKPVRTTTMLMIENPQGELLLQQRLSTGLWGGLWSFPEGDAVDDTLLQFDIDSTCVESQARRDKFRHSFTHFHLEITPIHVKLTETPATIGEKPIVWYSPSEPAEIGLTGPVTRLLKEL
jgi:A/G-specific adenine glycosylase